METLLHKMRDIVRQCDTARVPVWVKQLHLPIIIPTKNITGDMPKKVRPYVEIGKKYRAILNKHGALSAITKRGLLGLKPDEYKTVGYWLCKDITMFPEDLRRRE